MKVNNGTIGYTIIAIGTLSLCLVNLFVGTFYNPLLNTHNTTSLEFFRSGRSAVKEHTVLAQPEANVSNRLPSSKAVSARPPLDSIVQGWNITGDPSWLLDFAIIGFPKCGTSSMMYHLQSHPEIQIFSDERCDMGYNQHVKLIRDLYNQFPAGDYKRGIKCPMDLENTILSLPNYQKVFPKANFIVGIRHPVLWFESFYNFRIHNQFPISPPETLIGRCRKGGFNVCTFRSNYHLHLGNLGKTNMSDPAELKYIAPSFRRSIKVVPTKQKVFLYEVSQLSDTDPDRETQFLQDLHDFLHLQEPIDRMIWFRPGKNQTEYSLKTINAKKIDICHDEYKGIHQVLMEQAVNASRWIREFFVDAPDVTVSSKDYFRHLMAQWERDPCLDRKGKA